MIAGNPAEVRIEYFPNERVEYYDYSNLLRSDDLGNM